jgi:hypothetical protein
MSTETRMAALIWLEAANLAMTLAILVRVLQ